MTDQANNLRALMNNRQSDGEKTPAGEASLARVITISAGKSGVGKSNLAINLAIQFIKAGKRCIVIDGDYKHINTTKLLGIEPKYSLKDVVEGNKEISEIIVDGPGGIRLISGGAGFFKLSGAGDKQKLNPAEYDRQISRFTEKLALLDDISDIILIDTGAGMQNQIVDFVSASNEVILVITPQAESITGAYALIKRAKEKGDDLPEFNIVTNCVKVDSLGDEIFGKLERAIGKFLHIPLKHIGDLPYDPDLIKSIKDKQPVSLMYPVSPVATNTWHIVEHLIDEDRSNISTLGFKRFMQKLLVKFNNN
ncbi:MAG: AAA family ATPase [Defluviitaleaceae bacterium]|nr:AAA family ATPase [Defluviitaleaceae bacterium]